MLFNKISLIAFHNTKISGVNLVSRISDNFKIGVIIHRILPQVRDLVKPKNSNGISHKSDEAWLLGTGTDSKIIEFPYSQYFIALSVYEEIGNII